ncbi:winged helix-turn-helix transcriptional regulator [Olsenella umbonata]|jgi:DNA-binding MarR family transcriptional regulator|uniref:Winged helix-turn-helix transcriptional regulator n=1 Tax=Parafannyhessea umbonata TaxID=604330 RepID=A0A6N7X9I2_9ACTN|nr:winged helix-turn-helix transcriptional regulator [Parafannyhessea umbonata]
MRAHGRIGHAAGWKVPPARDRAGEKSVANERFESFVGVIYALNKEVGRIKTQKMASLGLRGTDTMVLYYLAHADGDLAEANLARLMRQDRAAVTRIVSRLEAQGLVERGHASEDAKVRGSRYRAPVTLTAAGRKAALDMDQIINDVVAEASADIGPEEREHMYTWLTQVLESLERI